MFPFVGKVGVSTFSLKVEEKQQKLSKITLLLVGVIRNGTMIQ